LQEKYLKKMFIVKKKLFVILILVFFFSDIKAHGDLSVLIIEKTTEISKAPKKAILYYERGYLYQKHKEFKKAIKDYKKSESLGLKNKLLYFRKSESYYEANRLKQALNSSEICLGYDKQDIKIYKLKAQILYKLEMYDEAIKAYKYVIENTTDLRPEDYIAFSDIILAIDNKNHKSAIAALNIGLKELGKDAITFQLKKLEYLKKSNQKNGVIDQYNSIIRKYRRKEFWYYEKAKYLQEIGEDVSSNIALQQSKLAIQELKMKYQNIVAIKELQININELEKNLNL